MDEPKPAAGRLSGSLRESIKNMRNPINMRLTISFCILLSSLFALAQKPSLGLPYGHTDIVHNITFSADGQQLYSGSEDESHKVWDIKTGKLLRTSSKLNSAILSSVASPGLRYVTSSMGWTDGSYWFFDFEKPNNRGIYGLYIGSFSADERWGMDESGQLVELANPKNVQPAPAFQPDGFTPDGRHFYKFTEGKLQLWDADTGQLQQTVTIAGSDSRPGFAANGKILQEYVIPDGQEGRRGESYKLWLTETGKFLYEFTVPERHYLEDVTPDGKYVLLTGFDGRVKLFDPVKGDTVLVYNRPGEPQESYLFERTADSKISPDGKLMARGRGDGTIYLQELLTGKLVQTFQAHNWPPIFLQFNRDHTLLCGTNEGRAHLWDLRQSRVVAAAGKRIGGQLHASGFAPIDQEQLLFYHPNNNLERHDLSQQDQNILYRFPPDSRERFIDYSPVLQTAWFHGRKEDFETVIKAYDLSRQPAGVDYLPPVNLTGVSPDGKLGVSFDLVDVQGGGRQLRGQLYSMPNLVPHRELESARGDYKNARKVIFSADQRQLLMLTDYELQDGTTSYVWDLNSGRLVQALDDPEGGYVDCGAFSPDGQTILLGSWSQYIYWFDLSTGQLLHTFKGHNGRINSVTFSPDGKRMVSGADDGTVKIWDLGTKEEIVTLINIDRDDWIVLGPDGLFDASPNAMGLMYYTVETSGKPEIIELEQLKARYYEPGLLQKLTGLSDERIRSVEGLNEVPLYPEVTAAIEQDQLRIQLKVRSGGIGQVSIFANGKEVVNDANPQRQTRISYDLKQAQQLLFRHPDSTNIISLRVYNQAGWLKSSAIEFTYQPSGWPKGSAGNAGSTDWQAKLDPKMYVVTVGTSDYTGTQLDLQYATQDATAMARAMEAVGSNLFTAGDSIEVYCLTTASPDSTGLEGTNVQWRFASKDNVRATLDGIKKKAKAEDILLVYLSGHGVTYGSAEQSQFYYLTGSVASEEMISDAEVRNKYTVSSGELTEWINSIAALKQVLVIDACNSGKVVETLTGGTRNLNSGQIRALDRMKDRTGMFILSGSAADKVSYEASEYGQGLLTYSLLQGMLGVATRKTADGDFVDVMKLFQHARDEVPRLAASINGIQTPMLGFPKTGASFDIGIVDQNTKIPIGNKKPVIIRPNFLNQATLKDDLGLVKLLETEFRKETEKGKDADLIYVDVSEHPRAYSLNGLYTKNGTEININIKLFENGQNPKDLEIRPTDDPERLVRYIVREVKRVLQE